MYFHYENEINIKSINLGWSNIQNRVNIFCSAISHSHTVYLTNVCSKTDDRPKHVTSIFLLDKTMSD